MVKTKLKNKVIIIALLILLFIGVLSNITKEVLAANTFFPQGYTDDDGDGNYEIEHEADIDKLDIGDTVKVRKGVLTLNKNVFCVQHGQALPGDLATYQVKEQYTITPEGINKKYKDGSGILKELNISEDDDSDLVNFAQGIAYILQLNNEWDGSVDSQEPSDASQAQRILWKYLDEASTEYCNAVGMDPSKSGATTVTLKAGEQKLFNTAMKLWKGDSYTETNYDTDALKRAYKAEYYTFANVSNNTQKLILLKSTSDVVKDNKKIEITINKKDYDEGTIIQAGFTVKFTQGGASIPGISNKTLTTTGGTASTGEIEITDTSKDVVVTITETSVPDGYIGLGGNITLTFKYEDHKWKKVSQTISDTDTDYVSISGTNDITLDIKNERIKKFYLDLTKKSSIDGADINAMDGTKFEINFNLVDKFKVYGKYLSDGFLPNSLYEVSIEDVTCKWSIAGEEIPNVLQVCDGKIQFEEITPRTIVWHEMKNVFIRISEKEALDGYKKLNRKILIKANLSDPENIDIDYYVSPENIGDEFEDIWEKIISGESYSIADTWTTDLDNAGADLKKEINKLDANGAKISLELTNEKLITITGTVWLDGQTGIKTAEPANGKIDSGENAPNTTVTVYLCKKMDGLGGISVIQKTQTVENGTYKFENIAAQNGLFVAFEYDGINYITTEKCNNQSLSDYLKRSHVEEDDIKIFGKLSDYKAISSLSRNDFNNQFKKVVKDEAYSLNADGVEDKKTLLKYDETATTSTLNIENSKNANTVRNRLKDALDNHSVNLDSFLGFLNSIWDRGDAFFEPIKEAFTGEADRMFEMYAISDINTAYTRDVILEDGTVESQVIINCGLLKREFDLDLTTNLESVNVQVNGQSTKYNYAIDENGNATLQLLEDREAGNEDGTLTKPTYNQSIYESDYNYNIDDYYNDSTAAGPNFESPYDVDATINSSDGVTAQELDVYVTYRIKLNNQTKENATIYEIKDYFSNDFEFNSAMIGYEDEKGNLILNDYNFDTKIYTEEELKSIFDVFGDHDAEKSRIEIDYTNDYQNKHCVTIQFIDGIQPTESQLLYLTFKVKDSSGILKGETRNSIGNIAEITSYGSEKGFIDMNSQPGNALNGSNVKMEDDTDQAGLLTIKKSAEKRNLSGLVWDDSCDENGKYDGKADEKGISDVTVQLIELKEIGGIQLEYIWQEALTAGSDGKSSLKTRSLTGEIINETIITGLPQGGFKFEGFIPGKYIIRYKYGTDKCIEYDGNAYKSTYDKTGENRYLGKDITNNLSEGTRYSDAYDNEARRLGEMAIFAGDEIDAESVAEINKHWMCADSNEFTVHISENGKNIIGQDQISQEVETQKEGNTFNNITEYVLKNVDFGLMKRPEPEVSLEKHLTALSIDVAGEGKILDATFDLAKYLEERAKGNNPNIADYIKGNSNNLTQIISTRDERGFWKFETDVNELMNGAELSAEYTYVVTNNTDYGETDYLTKQLVNAYEKLTSGFNCEFVYEDGTKETLVPGEDAYRNLLLNLESKTKVRQRKGNHINGYYIGSCYYTGTPNEGDLLTSDSPVTVQVNKIEELLNNEFVFDESINYSSYGDNKNNSSAYKTTALEKLIDYQYAEYDAARNIISNDYKIYDDAHNVQKVNIAIEKEPITGKETVKISSHDPSDLTINYKEGYTIVQTRGGNRFLKPLSSTSELSDRMDIARKIVLTKTLNTNNINDLSFDSYNAEILSYSVASGRRITNSKPGNMNDTRYSYTADKTKTLDNDNFESDEFWGETIIITAPTGNNTALWIILGVTCALIIAGGVFGIKKFVLKH